MERLHRFQKWTGLDIVSETNNGTISITLLYPPGSKKSFQGKRIMLGKWFHCLQSPGLVIILDPIGIWRGSVCFKAVLVLTLFLKQTVVLYLLLSYIREQEVFSGTRNYAWKVFPLTTDSRLGGNTLPNWYMERLNMFERSITLILKSYWRGLTPNVDIWRSLGQNTI